MEDSVSQEENSEDDFKIAVGRKRVPVPLVVKAKIGAKEKINNKYDEDEEFTVYE